MKDTLLLIIWSAPILKGDFSEAPMLVSSFVYLASDGYGFTNWRRLAKKQNKGE